MNTGVASECLGPNQCATTFVGPTGLGAAFNRDMWASKGTVLSTEMRAFANARWYRGTGAGYPGHPANKPAHIGTSAFGPNLNAIRDPRYGRNSEVRQLHVGATMHAARKTHTASRVCERETQPRALDKTGLTRPVHATDC